MSNNEILEYRDQINAYLRASHRALEAARFNLAQGFYGTATNRAYYAIFYAASGLLWSQGISRSKHTGVLVRSVIISSNPASSNGNIASSMARPWSPG